MRGWKLVVVMAVALGGAVGSVFVGNSTVYAESPECGDNSIIRCGAMTAAELKQKYAENDRGLQGIYSYYNISAADIANSANAKTGYVDTDGNVTVDGVVVATGAHTTGRSASLGGSKVNAGGTEVYEGSDRLKSKLSAFVFFNDDGTYKSAILKVCGNPVKATPVEKPKEPVYSCDALTATSISRLEYEFTTEATAENGAEIVSYTYNFGDGETYTGGSSTRHTYEKAGTYNAYVTLKVKRDGKTVDVTGDCKAKITIKQETMKVCDLKTRTVITINKEDFDDTKHTEDLSKCDDIKVCVLETKEIKTITRKQYEQNKDRYTTDLSVCDVTPVTPEKPETKLPSTGLSDWLGGGLSLGALTGAGYYYYTSRRLF